MEPSLSPINGVLFDLDGTLVDTYELILSSFRYATRTVLGRVIPDEELMLKVGQPLAAQMRDWTDSEEVVEELLVVYRRYNKEIHDEVIREFEGIESLVDALRSQAAQPGGKRAGIVTSKLHAVAFKGLARFGYQDAFELLIGSDDCQKHKPDPAPVLLACERLGLSPDECVYVGDSPYDIMSGNAAGCKTVAALWGMFSKKSLMGAQPTYLCESPADLQDLLGL